MSIRIALIGAGNMGADHARTLATQVPGATLQVICDADGSRARMVADAYGASRVTDDPLAAIADTAVDAVLIASPDATHGPLTVAAIKAGKPVLCEKPLAPTSGGCLEVIAAEVEGGKRLVQVGFMRRFDPSYVEVKAAIGRGGIGTPLMVHCVHRNVSAPSWFTSEMAITNSAPHEFDIVRWLLETDYATINVFRPNLGDTAKPGAPVFVLARTTSGQLVDIEVNVNAAYGYDVRGEVVCERGTVSLRTPVFSETNASLAQSVAYAEDWRPRFADAYRRQLLAWLKSIETGVPAGASAWDGYYATLVAEAGVASLSRGASVDIVPIARPSLYSPGP